jgi:predicted Zn finger-like uncharacterized protein
MLKYYCPYCKEQITVKSSALPRNGNTVRCVKCGNLIDVDKIDYTFA